MGIAGLILGLGLLVATGLSQQLESTERNLTSNVEIIPGNPTNDYNSQITNAFTYSNDSGATNAPTISIPTSPQDFSSDREGGESEKEVSANGDTKLIGSGATNTNYTRQGGIFQLLFGGPRLCNCPCGRSNTITRILGGEFVQVNEFPWLVLINVRGIVSFGGVLLNDRYVVTAASQLVGLTPFDVKVTLGEHDRCYPDVSTVNMSVEFIRLHQEYDPLTKSHDIALLRLSNSVTFEKRISPICLPVVGTDYTDQVAILVGWGEGPNAEGGVVSTCRPRKLGLPILSERECLVSNYEPGLVTRDKGCAGVLGGQSVVCSTDAGGPVQFKTLRGIYELIGVLSDVNVCNQNSSPALFTRIDFFMDWIIEYTRDSCYCTK